MSDVALCGWSAPAKLNLFLHITGRRADGYHLLQTVFQFLDYGDRLHFDVREDGVVHRVTDIADIEADDDLTVRAARLLQKSTNCRFGVDIVLDKRLPMGGGLGGGSSDAATTLVALNQLWGTQLSQQALMALGLMLGADVPVFINGVAAWAEGVGEQLVPLALPEPWYVVIIPPCHVSTAEIFNLEDLTRNNEPITIERFLEGEGGNVCEPLVAKRYPLVAKALAWLGYYAPARMSGTGACVFAAFDDESRAREVLGHKPDEFAGFVAKGVNISPLK